MANTDIKRLDVALRRANKTRSDLMEDLSLSKQRLHNWGKRGIPPAELPRLAVYTGVTIDEFVGRRSFYRDDATRRSLHDKIDAMSASELHMLDALLTAVEASRQAGMASQPELDTPGKSRAKGKP